MVNCTLQQLEIFIMVAERLNLTETAKTMYISQSAISKTISRLESSLEMSLFIRGNKGLGLTQEGEFLYNSLKQPLKKITKNIETAQTMRRRPKKLLRIGCPSSYEYNSEYASVKNTINRYRDKYPDVEVSESLYEFETLKESLMFAEADLIITQTFLASSMENVSVMRLAELGTYIAMAQNCPLAHCEVLPLDRLKEQTFIQVNTSTEAQVSRNTMSLCARMGIEPKEIRFVPNMQTLIYVLSQGQGVSICGRIDNTTPDRALKFYPFPSDSGLEKQYIVAVWRADDVSNEAANMIKLMRETEIK